TGVAFRGTPAADDASALIARGAAAAAAGSAPRQRRVEILGDADPAAQGAKSARATSRPDRNELRDRAPVARDHDLFALRGTVEEPRQVGLGRVDADLHDSSLVWSDLPAHGRRRKGRRGDHEITPPAAPPAPAAAPPAARAGARRGRSPGAPPPRPQGCSPPRSGSRSPSRAGR